MQITFSVNEKAALPDFMTRYELSKSLGYGRLRSALISFQTRHHNLENLTEFFFHRLKDRLNDDLSNYCKRWIKAKKFDDDQNQFSTGYAKIIQIIFRNGFPGNLNIQHFFEKLAGCEIQKVNYNSEKKHIIIKDYTETVADTVINQFAINIQNQNNIHPDFISKESEFKTLSKNFYHKKLIKNIIWQRNKYLIEIVQKLHLKAESKLL